MLQLQSSQSELSGQSPDYCPNNHALRPHNCLQGPRVGPAGAPRKQEATFRLAPHTSPRLSWVGGCCCFVIILPCVSCAALAARITTSFPSCGRIQLQFACLGASVALRQRKLRSKRSPTGCLPSHIRCRCRPPLPPPGYCGKRTLDNSEDQSRYQQGP